MIGSPFLAGRDRYERVMEGWVDNTHDTAFTHTVQITDLDGAVEVSLVATPSPGYEVQAASARALAGVDPAIAADFPALAGTRMVGGFTKRLAELCGSRTGRGAVRRRGHRGGPAGPPGHQAARGRHRGARTRTTRCACWQLDTTGWVDLPDSCFTYSQAGRALFGTRPVTTPMVTALYSPPPGARKVFTRKKVARLVLTGRRLHLFHSMHDNVHGFDLHYEVDLDRGTVVAADSVTSRLPYAGICSEPQGKIRSLLGQPVDALLRKRIQTSLGGSSGLRPALRPDRRPAQAARRCRTVSDC